MSWVEVLLAIPVISVFGALAGWGVYREMERRHGVIQAEKDEFREIARALGVDPGEARGLALSCVAAGMTGDDVERMVRRWARDGSF